MNRIPRILVTNDDGFDAPGIKALCVALRDFFGPSIPLCVAAPDRGRSECGHSVTTGRPLRVVEQRPRQYAIDGTPADCVRVALSTFAADVDLVVSGINAGANLGVDLLVSGTFAAAREAALLGKSAIAISHYRHPDVPKTWDHVGRWLTPVWQAWQSEGELSSPHSKAKLWNVNLPALSPETDQPPLAYCSVDPTPMLRTGALTGEHFESQTDFHGRPRQPGLDVDLCFSGTLTISPVRPFTS